MSEQPILKAIQDRRSIRSFTNASLTQEQIEQLAKAVLAAPSARNRQLLRYTFILNEDAIEQLSQASIKSFIEHGDDKQVELIYSRHPSLFYGAPLVVLISMPISGSDYTRIDAGIAVQTLALAAQGIGLGSCIIGLTEAAFEGSQANEIRKLVHMSDDHVFAISIAIGHPAATKEPHDYRPENIFYLR
jgi:nitroreductase